MITKTITVEIPAGTIQAFVPNDIVSMYKKNMEHVFGEGACHVLKVRPYGGMKVL